MVDECLLASLSRLCRHGGSSLVDIAILNNAVPYLFPHKDDDAPYFRFEHLDMPLSGMSPGHLHRHNSDEVDETYRSRFAEPHLEAASCVSTWLVR